MIANSIKRFFHVLSLNELNMMNNKLLTSDITYNTLLYLDLINLTPDCTVSSIARQLHISKPAVTAKINELIAQGLVEKTQSEKDKRVYYLRIMNEAAETYAEYNRSLTRAVEHIGSNFTEEELSVFCQILEEISSKYMEEIEDGK